MSKLSKKELDPLKEQEQKKAAIRNDLGVLQVQKHSLLHIYAEIESQQIESKKVLEKKYGKINIDLKDGSFEIIKEE